MKNPTYITLALAMLTSSIVYAHPGRTNSEGCHNNRKTGDYHCHGGGSSSRSAYSAPKRMYCTSFATQDEAQRYSDAHPEANLDKDGDGIACESLAGGSSNSRKSSTTIATTASAYGVYSAIPNNRDIIGRVVGITDGDTLTVLDDARTQHTIRLNAIDAPESGQLFGQNSKRALSDICYNTTATVKYIDTDRYGRTVGDVACNDVSVNSSMVSQGMAWVYDKYAAGYDYLYPLQESAKNEGFGLWSDKNAIAPWDWRTGKRTSDNSMFGNVIKDVFKSILFGR